MQSWTTTKIELDIDKNETGRFLFKEFTLDSRGNVLDETEYNSDSSLACKRIYRYFDNDTVKEFIEYDPSDELIERHEYVENRDGDIERIIYTYTNGHRIVKKFNFQGAGLADTATLYDETDAIVGYETYILNDDGHIVEQVERNADDMELVKYTKVYDEFGNAISEKKFVDGKLTETVAYSYDETGNVVRKVTINKAHTFEMIDEYKYDQFGNILQHITFQNGFVVFENRCTYDRFHNLATEEFFEINYWEKRITRHEKLIHSISE